MLERSWVARVAIAGVAASALAVGAAGPAAAQAPRDARINIVGGTQFVPGHHVMDNQRFSKRVTRVRSGGTIRVTNRARTRDPHTLSLVKRSQLPRSFDCEACGPFFGAHEVNEETGQAGRPLVDVGASGFNQAGDSIVIEPRERVRFEVTAARGKNLYYLCAVHPWMQGRIAVR